MRQVASELRAAAEAHGQELKTEFEGIVSDWENQPDFIVEPKVSAQEIRVEVRPRKRRKASTIFGYVDRGTDGPYPIAPKARNKRERLAFQMGYSARTAPVAQAHVGSGSASGPWVFPQVVMHPGIKARLFSETIQKRTYPKFRRSIESVFRRMAARQRG